MCAIAGMVGLPCNPAVVEKMLSTMYRRGPDERGLYQDQLCTLLHSRLAIIDFENGKQPMMLDRAGETYVLAYNGELYNTDELRRELLKCGHTFIGHSDTEVVLHAYAQWKECALEKFNGIFAFAIWEAKEKRLFLARDRMGVKPLFYKIHDTGILFSSEIKTILSYPSVKAELTVEGAAELLLLGPGRTPGSGILREIKELEPGCCGYFDGSRVLQKRYWKLMDHEHTDSFEATAEKVRFLVEDSICRQMVSDVPIGTFLSGGLDSSIISAICAEQMRLQGKRLQTFSIDYEDNEKYFSAEKFQPNADTSYINIMQKYLGTEHYWTILTPEELLEDLENATLARDLPGMADVDFSLLAFCRETRPHVKVALSGECADEIFGGYPWYRDPAIRQQVGFPWAQNTAQRAGMLKSEVLSQIDPQEFVAERYQQTLLECDILPLTDPEEKRMKEMTNLNYRWFMQTLLDRKDRMSMYSGLEVRVPFCDYRIVEYLYSVPWGYKDYNGREKGLLRYAMRGILPDEILYRKKSPYPKTYDPRYFKLVLQKLQDILNDKEAPLLQLVESSALQDLIDHEYAWPWYGQLMRKPQTIAYMLQINYWMKAYNIMLI